MALSETIDVLTTNLPDSWKYLFSVTAAVSASTGLVLNAKMNQKKYLRTITETLKSYGFTIVDSPQKILGHRKLEYDYVITVIAPSSPKKTTILVDTPNMFQSFQDDWQGGMQIGEKNTGNNYYKSFAEFQQYLENNYAKIHNEYVAPTLKVERR